MEVACVLRSKESVSIKQLKEEVRQFGEDGEYIQEGKRHYDVKMRAGEVGRGQVIQTLVENVEIFTPKHKKLLKDLTVWGGMRLSITL